MFKYIIVSTSNLAVIFLDMYGGYSGIKEVVQEGS